MISNQKLFKSLLLLGFLLALASLVMAAEERPDCQQESEPCSGVGRCKNDGVCECPASRYGWTCALKPPELHSGWIAPGQVKSGHFQRYHIPEGKWSEGARIYISSPDELISIVASIGDLPVNGQGAQFTGAPLTSEQNLELVVSTEEPALSEVPNKDLYIMVLGPARTDATATYTIKYEEDTSILGMPEWLFYLLVSVVGLCCLILTAGCIFGGTVLYKKWQRQRKVNKGFALTSFDDNTKGGSSAGKDTALGYESSAQYDATAQSYAGSSQYGGAAASAYNDASQYGGSVAGSQYGGGSAYGGYANAGGSYNSAAQYGGGSYANASQYGGSAYGGSNGSAGSVGGYATELQRGGSMQPSYGSTAQAGYGGGYGQY